jgi:hypothetical protein
VRTGAGAAWGEQHHDLSHGTERLFTPGYAANLVSSWIPALNGVESALRAGATVADIGHGASTLVMAAAYPKSSFVGFDYDAGSIEVAQARAQEQGLSDRVRFQVAAANDFPGSGYALATDPPVPPLPCAMGRTCWSSRSSTTERPAAPTAKQGTD